MDGDADLRLVSGVRPHIAERFAVARANLESTYGQKLSSAEVEKPLKVRSSKSHDNNLYLYDPCRGSAVTFRPQEYKSGHPEDNPRESSREMCDKPPSSRLGMSRCSKPGDFHACPPTFDTPIVKLFSINDLVHLMKIETDQTNIISVRLELNRPVVSGMMPVKSGYRGGVEEATAAGSKEYKRQPLAELNENHLHGESVYKSSIDYQAVLKEYIKATGQDDIVSLTEKTDRDRIARRGRHSVHTNVPIFQ